MSSIGGLVQERKREPESTEREIHVALRQDSIGKIAKVSESFKALQDAMRQFSSAVPHTRGIDRIKIASSELFIAHAEMLKAHQSLKDFEIRGTVPATLPAAMTGAAELRIS